MATDNKDLIICRCEEITRGEIEEAVRRGDRTINEIKKRTSACMGICGGKTCSRLITNIIKELAGADYEDIDQNNARPPVRPISLDALGEGEV